MLREGGGGWPGQRGRGGLREDKGGGRGDIKGERRWQGEGGRGALKGHVNRKKGWR